MPTNRRKIDRNKDGTVTPEVVASWHAADYTALHRALALKPWQESPLPPELHGIDPDKVPQHKWDRQSLRLQRKLMKLCGWPNDCRHVYEEDLQRAREWEVYCRDLVEHPHRAGYGTGTDPQSLRQKLEDAQEKVQYREELLASLDTAGT
jgi:hypothetical protein